MICIDDVDENYKTNQREHTANKFERIFKLFKTIHTKGDSHTQDISLRLQFKHWIGNEKREKKSEGQTQWQGNDWKTISLLHQLHH